MLFNPDLIYIDSHRIFAHAIELNRVDVSKSTHEPGPSAGSHKFSHHCCLKRTCQMQTDLSETACPTSSHTVRARDQQQDTQVDKSKPKTQASEYRAN